jgi:hypothetical protein
MEKQFTKKQYKQVKKNIIQVIKYINSNKDIDLINDIKTNLKILIDLWNNQEEKDIFNLDYYINMKQYHSFINGHIEDENLNDKWNIYIQSICNYRIHLMKLQNQ